MAADEDEVTPDPIAAFEEEEDEGTEEVEAEPDVEELEEDGEDAVFGLEEDDDAETVTDPAEAEDEEEAEAEEAPTTRTKRRVVPAGEEEEDEDEEMLSPDDVEADLDRILKDRLVTAEEDEDEDEEDEPDERGDPGDRLQPKRADEQLCSNCFLLVRANAPGCPVGDDDCPIFGR